MSAWIEGPRLLDESLEWMSADGLGGFASGTVGGLRTRRYHGLLTAARTPPTGRELLVADLEVELELGGRRRHLSSRRYLPEVIHPDGRERLVSFSADPVPTWTFAVPGGHVEQRVIACRGLPLVTIEWRLLARASVHAGACLRLRPLLAARDIHALCRQDAGTDLAAHASAGRVSWRPREGGTSVVALFEGAYRHDPCWYLDCLLSEERARGYDCVEDLASPGELTLDFASGAARLTLLAEGPRLPRLEGGARRLEELLAAELERRSRAHPLHRAADEYVVRRGQGHTIVAGYPWFADWGRDTFIALRGLCLARGELDTAGSILTAWAPLVSEGMLPNRFVDAGEEPEYNSVDASLWFVVAAGEYLEARGSAIEPGELDLLEGAIAAILEGYSAGTRYGIRCDADGLLAAGEPGSQLTWMDARVDGVPVTPRVGKPVEVQALWANALRVGARLDPRWERPLAELRSSFEARFWDAERGWLCDLVDADHEPGRSDETLRPNQVLAVGGLPLALLEGAPARRVVDELEQRLWTPLGLRTLDPAHPDHRAVYRGDPAARDLAYHQGVAWPWLAGPFVEAWVRVRGGGARIRRRARERFLPVLRAHLGEAGLGHVSELADGDTGNRPGGAPFQAWSLGELLRLELTVLPAERAPRSRGVARSPRRGGAAC